MAILFPVLFGFSFMISVISLFQAIIIRSWKSFLGLGIVSLPYSIYFYGGEPPIQYLGLFSIICFAIALLILLKKKGDRAIDPGEV